MDQAPGDVTQLFKRMENGDSDAGRVAGTGSFVAIAARAMHELGPAMESLPRSLQVELFP